MDHWKWRLVLAGCIISVLSVVLMAARHFSATFAGLLVVGIILLIVGLIWKGKEEKKGPQ